MELEPYLPYYNDGQEVMQGDVILHCRERVRTILNVFPPDHEVSIYTGMTEGCAEISPHTIEPLPLDEDIVLIRRAPGFAD